MHGITVEEIKKKNPNLDWDSVRRHRDLAKKVGRYGLFIKQGKKQFADRRPAVRAQGDNTVRLSNARS